MSPIQVAPSAFDEEVQKALGAPVPPQQQRRTLMGRCWVVDAPLITLLSKTDHVNLLSACTETLLVPAAVANEVREGGEDDPARQWLDPDGGRFVDASGPVGSTVAAWDLGRGKSRVLSHEFRHEAWTAVVDDGAARRCAQGLDIPVIGTLGVLVVAKKKGRLEAVRPAISARQSAPCSRPVST